jgi:hypothetical protein
MSIYYNYGRDIARMKLGMEAGVVPYAPSDSRDSSYSDNKKQLLWKNTDDEPFVTGDESGVGMPSPNKEASENDGGYGQGDGPYAAGSFDANREYPDHEQRNRDSIARAFETNRLSDQSFAPEAAMTQPHGPKLAFPVGMGARGISGTVKTPGNLMKLPKLPNPMSVKGIGQNARAGTLASLQNTRSGLASQAIGSAAGKAVIPPPVAGATGNISGAASISPSLGTPTVNTAMPSLGHKPTSGM